MAYTIIRSQDGLSAYCEKEVNGTTRSASFTWEHADKVLGDDQLQAHLAKMDKEASERDGVNENASWGAKKRKVGGFEFVTLSAEDASYDDASVIAGPVKVEFKSESGKVNWMNPVFSTEPLNGSLTFGFGGIKSSKSLHIKKSA